MNKFLLIIFALFALILSGCEAFSAGNTLTILNESNTTIKANVYESKTSVDDDSSTSIGIGSQAIFTIPSSLRDGYYLYVIIYNNSNEEIEYCFTYNDYTSFTLNFWDFDSSPTYTINEEGITEVI